MSTPNIYRDAIERVCKWRTLFVGWQLGTRVKGDPEGDAVRDHRETTILLRLEVTALTRLLIERCGIPLEEIQRVMAEEAEHLNAAYEKRFPGVTASDSGLRITRDAAEWMKHWKP